MKHLDVFVGGRFYATLHLKDIEFRSVVFTDSEMLYQYDFKSVVESRLPTLRGKDYSISI